MVLEAVKKVSDMTEVVVTVNRDEDGRPVLVLIEKGRKQLAVQLEYSPLSEGLSNLYQMRLKGRRDMMPTFGEVVQTIQELTEIQPLTKFGLDRLREEYNRQLMGVNCWLTPTVIPQFTAEEEGRGLAVQGGDVIIQRGVMRIPPESRVILKGNINFGTLMNHYAKWGIQPIANAWRSLGFDNPDWFEFIGFWMEGTVFKCRTQDYAGNTETDVTASFPADAHDTYHMYNIQWQSTSVRFYIDYTLVATHTANIPQQPAGLDWRVKDALAGDMVVKKGLELEQYRFLFDAVPSGTICMWHGLIANIPTGWVLCDGTNGTPDLRAKFVRGAPSGVEAGSTGGEDSHVLTVAEMPSHSHQYYRDPNIGASDVKGPVKGTDEALTNTSSVGGDQAHENRPAFYEVLFIMKT